MSGILDRLPFELKNCYASDFYLADEGYYAGRVAATSKARKSYWDHWNAYVRPLGMDPYLQDAPYIDKVRVLTGFAARVRGGGYGRGQRVQTSTVSTAVTAVGQTISLACGTNPTKIAGSDKMIPRLQQILDGWRKGDPPTKKQLPVEAEIFGGFGTSGDGYRAGPRCGGPGAYCVLLLTAHRGVHGKRATGRDQTNGPI